MAKTTEEALKKILKAGKIADMLELRLDVMQSFSLEDMVRGASKPVIVTYRSLKEGGKGSSDDLTRMRYLLKAIEAGAEFVDVEYRMPLEFRQKFLGLQGSCTVIMSVHLLKGTPEPVKLLDMLRKLAATGAGIVKIVTRAERPEDNLRVLDLIPVAKKLGVPIITFCMGPVGRISRVASPLCGGYLTFASLEEGEESAEGQIPVMEMKKILDLMSA